MVAGNRNAYIVLFLFYILSDLLVARKNPVPLRYAVADWRNLEAKLNCHVLTATMMALIKLKVMFVRHHVVYIKLAAFGRYVSNFEGTLLPKLDLKR